MKKNFLTGFFTGLGAMLLVAVLIISGFSINKSIKRISSQNPNTNQSNNTNQEDKIQYDNINNKLHLLESVIDEYFLEDVNKSDFEDGIYKGFVASLGDPYSTYYTSKEYEALMESSRGIYYGIGATINQNISTGIITIVKPFVTGPAFEKGMLPGDIIYKVEGEEVTGIDLSEVVGRIKGPEGTEVFVEILREDVSEPIGLYIPRRKIEVPTIEYEIIEGNIGYIIITEFDEITVKQFKDAVDELDSKDVSGIIIDLRDNPGGLLNSVVKMVDRIIEKGLVVYTEDKNGKREEENAINSDKYDKPIVVMINGNSASASEIFAGTLQDYEAAKILGTKSFGKGIVQKIISLPDNTALKITISKYYTAKGRDVHGIGIAPDIEIELDEELKKKVIIAHEEDNQLQEAIKTIKTME
ncbi:MAG TPA: S41 family peptidase [Clostridiales bacterium]|nr:S41 family peptidase [Clostridiales bacterium]